MKITVLEKDAKKRLDVFLASHEQIVSRSAAQKLITHGNVLVNGKRPSKTGVSLCAGDSIEIRFEIIEDEKDTNIELHILTETSDYVVLEKPAGLIVHAIAQIHESVALKKRVTLVDLLLKKYPEMRGVGDDPLRPGIVHRLDKDASGTMVIARTQDSFDSLKRQFKLRRVAKEYLILVYGNVTPLVGTIDLPITRSARHSTKFVGSLASGRQAITNYAVERSFGKYSLVRVRPETGRTHQIRVHFYSRGYPLVGDKVYAQKKMKVLLDARLMLHAASLEFQDLSGELKKYECPPGDDFMAVMKGIGA